VCVHTSTDAAEIHTQTRKETESFKRKERKDRQVVDITDSTQTERGCIDEGN
jgi:hypothetical protein